MRLASVLLGGQLHTVAAAHAGAPVRDLTDLTGGDLRRVLTTTATDLGTDVRRRPEVDLSEATWLPPVPSPGKVLCVGFNYRAHASEESRQIGEHPTLFTRFASTFVGHREPVLTPPESATLDWEGEIAVVIGRGGRRIPAAEAMDHVAGWTAMGENSVREFQLHSAQATAGKNWDRSGSWGPWLVTRDEVPDPSVLEVVTRLNDKEKQRGRLDQLSFDPAHLIAYISTFTELSPGDLIATGTPAGIGHREDPPRYLTEGDELSVTLLAGDTELLSLCNRVETDQSGTR